VLLVPAPPQLGHALVARRPGVGVAGEAAAVHPRRPALDGDHPVGDAGQQLAVVADEQDRLAGLEQPLLQPPLPGDVEVVVRLVEQQHLVRSLQQRLEREPLLLPARQRGQVAVLAPVVGDAERRDGHGVPGDLDVVAARVAPLGQGVGVGHLGCLVVGLHEGELGGLDGLPGGADGGRREVEQEPLHRGVVAHRADELAHHAESADAGDRPGLGLQVAGDDPQQRGLPGAVLPHQRGAGALTDPEGHLVQQHAPVGQGVPHTGHVDVAHPDILPGRRNRLPAAPPGRSDRLSADGVPGRLPRPGPQRTAVSRRTAAAPERGARPSPATP
jgi:hypothetical protein